MGSTNSSPRIMRRTMPILKARHSDGGIGDGEAAAGAGWGVPGSGAITSSSTWEAIANACDWLPERFPILTCGSQILAARAYFALASALARKGQSPPVEERPQGGWGCRFDY